MSKVYPDKLKNGDTVSINGRTYDVTRVEVEPNDRIRIYAFGGGSVSVPSTTKVEKT